MHRFRTVGTAVLLFALVANAAAAQTVPQTSPRDSLWNGTLIGLGAGLASTAALDAVFCENGFGGCDFPWAASLTLGGIGAAAGAGIDFLIGRTSDGRTTTLRLLPLVGPTRRGVLVSLRLPQAGSAGLARRHSSGRRAPELPRRDPGTVAHRFQLGPHD
jgi:opacity protein-like surface antigen